MGKNLFKFFLLFLFLSVGTIASAQQGQFGSVQLIQQGSSAVQNVVQPSDKEKAEEAVKANIEALKKIQQSRPNCGDVGQRCCNKNDAPSIPLISESIPNLTVEDTLNNANANSQKTQSDIDNLVKQAPCNIGGITVVDKQNPDLCTCQKEVRNLKILCDAIDNPAEREKSCKISCNGVWTALGCVDYELKGFVQKTLLGWGVGLAGVLAMLCIIYSAFVLQTSSGNPEKIKKAKERLTACIIGLLLIIFSIFILKLVGVNILQIPFFV